MYQDMWNNDYKNKNCDIAVIILYRKKQEKFRHLCIMETSPCEVDLIKPALI